MVSLTSWWRVLGIGLAVVSVAVPAAEEVNVYSARKEELIKPLLDQFTAKVGIKVNLVTGKEDALLQRLKSEGRNSPADVLLTADVGRLVEAVSRDLAHQVADQLMAKDALAVASSGAPDSSCRRTSIRRARTASSTSPRPI